DAVIDLAERRKDEGGRVDAFAAQRPDHRKTIKLRQHAVHDQHVVLAVKRLCESFLAVGRQVGDMADLAKCLGKIVVRIAVIFDDEETHEKMIVSWVGRRGGAGADRANHSGARLKCPCWRASEHSYPKKMRGAADDPPPLNQPRAGGGDGCRHGVGTSWGRALAPVPGFVSPAGATD